MRNDIDDQMNCKKKCCTYQWFEGVEPNHMEDNLGLQMKANYAYYEGF